LKHLSVPLPLPLKAATEVLFNTDLRWAFDDDDPDFTMIRQLVGQSREWGVHLDVQPLSYRFTRVLDRAAERWRDSSSQPELMQTLITGVELVGELPFSPILWKAQNIYFELSRNVFAGMVEQAALGNEASRLWVDDFIYLGERLGVEVDPLKKKLVELKRRPKLSDMVHELSASRSLP